MRAAILAEAAAAGVGSAAAPDTFLAAASRRRARCIDEGAIGTPSPRARPSRTGPERWHPNPGIFYAPGGGPLLDVGPYYVAALVSLLGPIAAVAAVGRGSGRERLDRGRATGRRDGDVEVPTTVVGSVDVRVGGRRRDHAPRSTSSRACAPHLEIHGTAGSLSLGDPNTFDGGVRYRPLGSDAWEDVPLRFDASVGRGVGLADLIEAIRTGRPHRAVRRVRVPRAGRAARRWRRRPTGDRWLAIAIDDGARPRPSRRSRRVPGAAGAASRAAGRCRPRSRGS